MPPSREALVSAPPAGGELGAPRPGSSWRIPIAVLAVALLVRILVLQRGGGLYALMGYDDGVYFTAAAKLLSGQLPYRDFTLLHPPLITLVLAPFAALGRWTSDRDAMAVARVAFLLVSAANAALTARVASRLGTVAAVVAGGFMAVSVTVVLADRSTQLQTLGTFLLLVALLALYPWTDRARIRVCHAQLLAGAALGLATCAKLWNAVPLLVVAVALLVTHGRRPALRLIAGAAAAGILVMGPFLLAAPAAMLRMTVQAQLGRPGIGSSPLERLPRLIGVLPYLSEDRVALVVAVTLVAGAVLVGLTVLALTAREARLWVALLAANSLVLLAAPVFFGIYAGFIAAPLSLVIGAATALVAAGLRRTAPGGVSAAAAAVTVTALAVLGLATVAAAPTRDSFPGQRLAGYLPADGCVRADSPSALIQLDILTTSLRRGCPVPVDFTGITYDRLARALPDGTPVPRESNQAWQAYARQYLMTGAATVLVRGPDNGFDDVTLRELGSLPVLGRADGWAVLGPPR
jgi:alpha-1,2-mannosyltransferase